MSIDSNDEFVVNFKRLLFDFIERNKASFEGLSAVQQKQALSGALSRLIEDMGEKILNKSNDENRQKEVNEGMSEMKEHLDEYIDEILSKW